VAALAGAAVALSLGLVRPWALSAEPFPGLKPDPAKGTASRAARESALAAIPFDKLDAEARAKVSSVLADVSLFRRMPIQVVQCDPELYLFLVQHPDVVVNIWEVMGVTQLAMHQTGPNTFHLADVAGAQGSVEYLYSSHDTHLIYVEGYYEGPLLARPIEGRGLLLLKTGYVLETDGRYYVTCRLDALMRIEHLGAELLTKTFRPLVGRTADINFTYTTAFLGNLSRTAEGNHEGVQRLAARLSKVRPELRDELAKLAQRVAEKADQPTHQAAAAQPLVAEEKGDRRIY